MRDLLVSLPPDADRAFVAWLNDEFSEMDPNGLALDAFVLEGGGAALRGVRDARGVAQPPTVTLLLSGVRRALGGRRGERDRVGAGRVVGVLRVAGGRRGSVTERPAPRRPRSGSGSRTSAVSPFTSTLKATTGGFGGRRGRGLRGRRGRRLGVGSARVGSGVGVAVGIRRRPATAAGWASASGSHPVAASGSRGRAGGHRRVRPSRCHPPCRRLPRSAAVSTSR